MPVPENVQTLSVLKFIADFILFQFKVYAKRYGLLECVQPPIDCVGFKVNVLLE